MSIQKHLTLSERIVIERMLFEHASFKSIKRFVTITFLRRQGLLGKLLMIAQIASSVATLPCVTQNYANNAFAVIVFIGIFIVMTIKKRLVYPSLLHHTFVMVVRNATDALLRSMFTPRLPLKGSMNSFVLSLDPASLFPKLKPSI